MRDGEWALVYPGTTYTFGTSATPVWNRTTPDIGDIEIRTADVDRPRADGRAFGVDFRSSRTISFDLGIRAHSEVDARAEEATLARAWRADAVRKTPGAVAELHAQYAGRERVVYGRPRRYAPNFSDVGVNYYATVTADFAVVDDLYYSAVEESVSFSIVPPVGGGLLAPLASPLSTTMTSDRSQAITVDTELPAWPVVEVHGPISNAVVTIGDLVKFEVRLSLAYDETVVIDTRPWHRSAMRNGTASVAGAVRGTMLAKAAIPAGAYEVGFRGVDPTGTASVRLSWRGAYSSL